jgi:hypothetical protein
MCQLTNASQMRRSRSVFWPDSILEVVIARIAGEKQQNYDRCRGRRGFASTAACLSALDIFREPQAAHPLHVEEMPHPCLERPFVRET